MTLDDIYRIRDDLMQVANKIDLGFQHGIDGVTLTAYAGTMESYLKLKELLKAHELHFLWVQAVLIDDGALTWKYIRRMDFFGFRDSISRWLKCQITSLASQGNLNPLYAFVLQAELGEFMLSVRVNTEEEWSKRKEHYAELGISAETELKYWPPEFGVEVDDPATTERDELWARSITLSELAREHYELTFGNRDFVCISDALFVQMAVHALKDSIRELDLLPRTKDFVYYVEATGSDLGFYAKMETIPMKQFRDIFPRLFQTGSLAE